MAKKRGQNMGSIYKRKDGRWVGQVTIEGKPHYKYFKTQRAAREWIKKTLAQIDEGLTFASTKTSLSDYMEHWIRTVKASVRPKTWVQYAQIVNQHILPTLGRTKLKDLSPTQIQLLYNSKLEGGTSSRTVILIHAVLHRSLNHALQQGMIGRNPAQAVTKPKLQQKEMQTLTETQARNLLLTVKGTRYEALYQLAVTTGLRQGELLGLKWSDLDWSTRRLNVQRQVYRLKGRGMVFSEPKSKAGRRVIVLGSSTIGKLSENYKLQERERQNARDRWKEHDLIFPSTVGTPINPSNLLKRFKIILKKTGLPNIRFHDLRHTAATLMLKQGTNPKIVQERLGHSSISLTLDIYSHVLPDMQEEVAENMDELIAPNDETSEQSSKKSQ